MIAPREAPELQSLAARLASVRGVAVAVEVPRHEVQALVHQIKIEVDRVCQDHAEVRLVLGTAATTCAAAADQFTAALQLPYAASRGWGDFLDAFGDRAASLQQLVLVADASQLLKYEAPDRWRELIGELYGGPHCLGGGWTTVVLLDDGFAWELTRFGSAEAAQHAAK